MEQATVIAGKVCVCAYKPTSATDSTIDVKTPPNSAPAPSRLLSQEIGERPKRLFEDEELRDNEVRFQAWWNGQVPKIPSDKMWLSESEARTAWREQDKYYTDKLVRLQREKEDLQNKNAMMFMEFKVEERALQERLSLAQRVVEEIKSLISLSEPAGNLPHGILVRLGSMGTLSDMLKEWDSALALGTSQATESDSDTKSGSVSAVKMTKGEK